MTVHYSLGLFKNPFLDGASTEMRTQCLLADDLSTKRRGGLE